MDADLVEDAVKTLKATGASHLPFHSFAANAAWFELALLAHDIMIWTQRLVLDGEHGVCEPKRLRYRILHVAGQLTRHARRLTLHRRSNAGGGFGGARLGPEGTAVSGGAAGAAPPRAATS